MNNVSLNKTFKCAIFFVFTPDLLICNFAGGRAYFRKVTLACGMHKKGILQSIKNNSKMKSLGQQI